jgi:hypothetical protein
MQHALQIFIILLIQGNIGSQTKTFSCSYPFTPTRSERTLVDRTYGPGLLYPYGSLQLLFVAGITKEIDPALDFNCSALGKAT